LQDFVEGQKNAEEFMVEMRKTLGVDNSQPVIFHFLENNIGFLRDSIFSGEIKLEDLLKPPLRQSSFTDKVFSAQLSSAQQTARGQNLYGRSLVRLLARHPWDSWPNNSSVDKRS
jgi:hypothetical protein